MDPRLLGYYNQELNYLRELGAEFAARYPKVASRLGMRGVEVEDPYVERMLEGAAFLTARVRVKMDAEFPRFSQRLLEVVYPNYLAPTPAMGIVQFTPGELTGAQGDHFTIKRGERLRSAAVLGNKTRCEFRTAHDVELWPLRLARAGFHGVPSAVQAERFRTGTRTVRSSLQLRLEFTAPLGADPALDRLALHLSGSAHIASRIYALLCGGALGVAVRARGKTVGEWCHLPEGALTPLGFSEAEALLPYSARGFQGYRLLHEYFAFPPRFHFVQLSGLNAALAGIERITELEVMVMLDREVGDLVATVDASHFALFCTPVVNLISMRADRIHVDDSRFEFHLVVDRSQPLNHEVYSVHAVDGFNKNNEVETRFRPFYQTTVGQKAGSGAYFSTRRESRMISDTMQRDGPRSAYIGSEVFVSLVDQHEAPYSGRMRQLGVALTATNRDLPLLMSVGGEHDLTPVSSMPVKAIRMLQGPSAPVAAIPEGELTWRLISHLSLSYQMLTDLEPAAGAEALKELLALYTALGDPAITSRGGAIQSATLQPRVRRLPGSGPMVYGRGVGIEVTVDEVPFSGVNPFLFGSVLEHFFARHVAINTFVQMRLHSAQHGVLHEWPPRYGARPVA